MAKLPNIFPHPFQLVGEPLELSRLASNPEEKRSGWKVEAELSGAASSFFCRVRPRAPAILKNLDNRLRNDLPSGLSSANVSPNKNKNKTLQRAGKREKELLKSFYTPEDTGRLMVPPAICPRDPALTDKKSCLATSPPSWPAPRLARSC